LARLAGFQSGTLVRRRAAFQETARQFVAAHILRQFIAVNFNFRQIPGAEASNHAIKLQRIKAAQVKRPFVRE
jgi:hypothetical protein